MADRSEGKKGAVEGPRSAMSWQAMAMFFLAVSAAPSAPLWAQEARTEHTYQRTPGVLPPKATIQDVAWLAGEWSGKGLGGQVSEAWSSPVGGAIVGWFRLVQNGLPVFYELMTVVEEEGGLVFKVKHFNPDMSGWEEPEETVDFPLVGIEDDAVHFEGLSYHKSADGGLVVYLAMSTGDGSYREEILTFSPSGH